MVEAKKVIPKDKILEDYLTGTVSIRELADKYDCSSSYVHKIVQSFNLNKELKALGELCKVVGTIMELQGEDGVTRAIDYALHTHGVKYNAN